MITATAAPHSHHRRHDPSPVNTSARTIYRYLQQHPLLTAVITVSIFIVVVAQQASLVIGALIVDVVLHLLFGRVVLTTGRHKAYRGGGKKTNTHKHTHKRDGEIKKRYEKWWRQGQDAKKRTTAYDEKGKLLQQAEEHTPTHSPAGLPHRRETPSSSVLLLTIQPPLNTLTRA